MPTGKSVNESGMLCHNELQHYRICTLIRLSSSASRGGREKKSATGKLVFGDQTPSDSLIALSKTVLNPHPEQVLQSALDTLEPMLEYTEQLVCNSHQSTNSKRLPKGVVEELASSRSHWAKCSLSQGYVSVSGTSTQDDDTCFAAMLSEDAYKELMDGCSEPDQALPDSKESLTLKILEQIAEPEASYFTPSVLEIMSIGTVTGFLSLQKNHYWVSGSASYSSLLFLQLDLFSLSR